MGMQGQRSVHMTPSLEVARALHPAAANEVGKCEAALHTLSGREGEIRSIEGEVYPRVALLRRKLEVLAEEVEQFPERVDRRGKPTGLDPRDCRLRGPGPARQHFLAYSVATT